MNDTTRYKKPSNFVMRCAACGLFLADATSHFDVIAVTYKADKALTFPDGEAAEHARKFMSSLYGSFDWRAVELDPYLDRKAEVFLLKRQAA
ncbi:hypothetical protein RY831_27710 [Noviherbaspirillum sp. CPCC 100848]|uniref:DUF1488 domain-containing protein n=1 Tax=Noviherbaspirillum album TaxID=3080276 RepID=A0ABU6JH07_9BURK|nr:hypothetical protein [Noviherbaspirillum sp. CPCC 100848]MEC4722951.1 hypothetical protein [Noviherbaspirillum sp. CPCC 100848]